MAITDQNSTQMDIIDGVVSGDLEAHGNHGRLRVAHFDAAQAGVGDAGSSVAITQLPPGKVRLLGASSNVYVNWTGASATMDAGWDAYTDINGGAVAADVNGLDDGVDVDAAGAHALGSAVASAGGSKVFESQDGVTIRLTSPDVALADGDSVAGYLVYVVD